MDSLNSKYKRKRPVVGPRVVLDYFMGLLWMFGGIFIIFSEKFLGYDYFEDSDLVQGWMKWFIGFIFVLYGLFRIYRGYQLQNENKKEN
jgi:hypothetical protein